MRFRKVLVKPAPGNLPCPALSEMRDCNTFKCPQNCEHRGWRPWSPCTKTCGTGMQSRTVIVTKESKYGGTKCPPDEDRVCNTKECAFVPTPAPTPNPSISTSCEDACPECCRSGLEKYCFDGHDATTQSYARRTCAKTCALCEQSSGTPAPTPAPSTACKTAFGTYKNGWHGRGFGGNYCNLCFCVNGEMMCSQKKCRKVEQSATPHTCSDVTCRPVYNPITGERRVQVHHGKKTERRGSRHHCQYSRALNECTCVCWGAVYEPHWSDTAAGRLANSMVRV